MRFGLLGCHEPGRPLDSLLDGHQGAGLAEIDDQGVLGPVVDEHVQRLHVGMRVSGEMHLVQTIGDLDEHAKEFVHRGVGVLLPFLEIFTVDVLEEEADIGRVLLVGIVDHRVRAAHACVVHRIGDTVLVHELFDPAFVFLVLDLHVLEQKNFVVPGACAPTTTSGTITLVSQRESLRRLS